MSEMYLNVNVHYPEVKEICRQDSGVVVVKLGGDNPFAEVTVFFRDQEGFEEFVRELAQQGADVSPGGVQK